MALEQAPQRQVENHPHPGLVMEKLEEMHLRLAGEKYMGKAPELVPERALRNVLSWFIVFFEQTTVVQFL